MVVMLRAKELLTSVRKGSTPRERILTLLHGILDMCRDANNAGDATWTEWMSVFKAMIPKFVSASVGTVERERRIPDAFPNGVGFGWNNPPMHGAVLAINKGVCYAAANIKGWVQSGNGDVWAFRIDHAGSQGNITYSIESPDGTPKLSPDEQLNIIRSFDGLTLDVFMAIMCQLTAPMDREAARYPNPQYITISTAAILSYKDFSKRGQDRLLLEGKIAARVDWLHNLTLRITAYPGPLRGKNRKYITLKTKLFHAEPLEVRQESCFGERILARVWKITVGSWAEYWWTRENNTARWVSGITRNLLELPSNEKGAEVAKKIALAMFLIPGMPLPLKAQTHTVESLLRGFVGLPASEKRGKDWAGRERDRLEAALDILVTRRILERVDWPDGYGPQDQNRTKGWAENWLSARVIMLPPLDPLWERPLAIQEPKTIPIPPKVKLSPSRIMSKIWTNREWLCIDTKTARLVREILQARMDQGMDIYDQGSLAKHLGISRTHLSNAMNGNMHLGRDHWDCLIAWVKDNKHLVGS